MKTINLKKYYYPLYETDTFIELPDEIADAIAEEWRTDHNSEQRLWSHTYSMDYSSAKNTVFSYIVTIFALAARRGRFGGWAFFNKLGG